MSSVKNPNSPFKAVLFDFDGVIGDTMEDNYRAWLYALGLFGATFTKDEYFRLEGHRVVDIAAKTLILRGKDPVHAAEVAKAKDDFYISNNNFKFSIGVEDLIQTLLENKIPIVLVTGGARKRILNDLTAPILDKLTYIVSADDCKTGKPDPEPYLMGANKIGVSPTQCLVIENAPLGIESANAAKMFCIAICSTLKPKDLNKADLIIDNFSGLKEILNIKNGAVFINQLSTYPYILAAQI
ncbi:MAG: HAD family phosphatase [bacterium]|nr:HAD family phosphatase [bacterium]